jgi:hypothetical protein
MLPEDAFRERAFAVLVQRLTEKLCIIESHQMDKLQTVSLTLQERYNQAEEYHKHLTREREELGCRVETLNAANVALDEWLKENEGSCKQPTLSLFNMFHVHLINAFDLLKDDLNRP